MHPITAISDMIQAKNMIAHVMFCILLFFEGLGKREHCQRNRVYVEDITQHSAVLHWKTSHVSRIKDYKVLCAGVRQYITVEGDREVDLDTVTQFVPQGVGRAFLNQLQPNFNYSCTVKALAEGHSRQETQPLLFSTLYSVPEEPTAPAIVLGDDGKQIDVQLFPTSTKYGPIDGYEVQFHILDEHTPHVHGQPDLPRELTQPRGLLASMEAAHTSIHPIPFCMVFRNKSLPSHITVSASFLQGALHSGPTYSVITVAYTDNYEEISNPSLYALSQPSKPFSLAVTMDRLPLSESTLHTLPWLESQLLKLSMAVGVVSSNIILLYFLMVGCCLLYMGNSRKGQLSDQQGDTSQAMNKEKRTDETESLPLTATHTLTMKKELPSRDLSAGSVSAVADSDGMCGQPPKEDTGCSVGSSPDMCSLDQAVATEQEANITPTIAAGGSVELATGNKLEHPSVEECILSPYLQGSDGYKISTLSSASHSAPSFENFALHIHQTSSKSELRSPQEDKMCTKGSTPITETVKTSMPSTFSLQLPIPSGCSLSVTEQAKATSGLHMASMSGSKSVQVSGSVHSHSLDAHSTSDLHPTAVVADTGEVATQQVGACGSSLVFIPRGLSRGPQPLQEQPHTGRQASEVNTTDLAPDLEMDLYGISYSLDEPQLDH